MAITSINTLEISFSERPDHHIETVLLNHIEQLKQSPGCLSYSLSQRMTGPTCWIVTGYWANENQMFDHFCQGAMTTFIDRLIEAEANLSFARFSANVEGPV
ncbi:hypothetical protein BZK31_12030 [Pseudomonas floridensis]|uniref:ABM domain-containing protein n=1 Tax=Pseudomonas floridensis TaxID=1958950 RepID=A0A1X0N681_9PSED|nr:antibiotic biosynthesis monooxygenase family protein [Pseudomonas floridensis]ORC59083.1 hypothetical protein BZK31_12030 [Pseudomonas floridensis]